MVGTVVIALILVFVLWGDGLLGARSPTDKLERQSPAAAHTPQMPDIEFVQILANTFKMGSTDGERDEQPVHTVTISQPFYMSATEVTQEQWKTVMGTEPWKGKKYVQVGDSFPAVYVSWEDVQTFLDGLNVLSESTQYRLPTEAEWEYAARAGTMTAYSFGDDESKLDDYAWFAANAWDAGEQYAHRVGQKQPNTWGLYDMHGNVWEWVSDWYDSDYYQDSPQSDPPGSETGPYKVIRGGSFSGTAGFARSSDRSNNALNSRIFYLGFRLVMEAQ